MDRRAWIAGLSLSLLGACNWVDGACWLKSEDNAGSGAGGAPIAPVGGGFGDAPDPTAQAAGDPPPPPECLQVPQGACFQKCLSDYEAAAGECGKIANDSQRSLCQQSAYTAYKTCRSACEQQQKQDKERCKQACDTINDVCHEKCNNKNPTPACHQKCNQDHADCLYDCEKDF